MVYVLPTLKTVAGQRHMLAQRQRCKARSGSVFNKLKEMNM